MSPQIAEIILVEKALVNAETELGEKHFPGVGPERGAAPPAQTVLLATNHETVEVKVAPIECDLEQFVQRGDATVAAHVQTPPNGRVNLEEQNLEQFVVGQAAGGGQNGGRGFETKFRCHDGIIGGCPGLCLEVAT